MNSQMASCSLTHGVWRLFHSLLRPRLPQLGNFCDPAKFPTTRSWLFSCVSQCWEEMNLYGQRPIIRNKSVTDFPEDFPQVKRIPGLGPKPGRKYGWKKICKDWSSMWTPESVLKQFKTSRCKTNFSKFYQWQWIDWYFCFVLFLGVFLNKQSGKRLVKHKRFFSKVLLTVWQGCFSPVLVTWSGVVNFPFPSQCCSLPFERETCCLCCWWETYSKFRCWGNWRGDEISPFLLKRKRFNLLCANMKFQTHLPGGSVGETGDSTTSVIPYEVCGSASPSSGCWLNHSLLWQASFWGLFAFKREKIPFVCD